MIAPFTSPSLSPKRWQIIFPVGLLLLLVAHSLALIYRIQPVVSLWFPPSGVAIALTLWLGLPGVWLTAIASFMMAPFWGNEGWSRVAALTDAMEPLLAWLLYCRYWRGSLSLNTLKDTIAFIISAPVIACGMSAVVGSFALVLLDRLPLEQWTSSIVPWWLGNAIGTMAIAPVALLVFTPQLQKWRWIEPTEPEHDRVALPLAKLEVAIILLLSIVLAVLTVAQTQSNNFAFQEFALLSFLPIIWAATRFGVKGGILIASFCVWMTLLIYLLVYPNAIALPTFPVPAEVLHIHKFSLLVQCVVSLLIGTAISERERTQIELTLQQAIVKDFTTLQQTEAALRQSEERFRSLSDCSPIGIFLTDKAGNCTYSNPRCQAICGFTLEQGLGDGWTRFIHPEDCEWVVQDWTKHAQTGQECFQQYRFCHADGTVCWVQARTAPLRSDGGEVIGHVGTLEDITQRVDDLNERQQAEAEIHRLNRDLEQRIAELQTLLDVIPVGIAIAEDPTAEQIKVNAYLSNLLQVPLSANASKSAPEDERPAYRAFRNGKEVPAEELPMQHAAIHGVEVRDAEFEVVAPNGSTVRLSAYVAPLRNKQGKSIGAVGAFMDVTEREQLLLREQEARKQAEAASRTKDEFLAIVSHELRSPLNAILGWARLLRSQQFDADTTHRALEAIERNAVAQTQLIEDLLDISRIIRGQVRLNLHPLRLQSIIAAAVDTVRPIADTKQIQLDIHLDPAVGLIMGDSDRLQQVVWNLLSNALKFTPKGGRVTVKLEQVGNQAYIQVIDTGKGIEPDFLPYVFDRFRQAEHATTRTQGGLGLGLAIVRNLLELHGGTVQASSSGQGQGATFTVELPLLEGAIYPSVPIAPDMPIALPSEATLNRLKVLVVDDEPDTRDFLATTLEHFGATVTSADSVHQALRLMSQFQPDVLLSDIGMPYEDGYALIRYVRNLPPEQGGTVPAAALTAYAREDDRLQALTAGFQMHVAKPIEPAKLVSVVETLAKNKSQCC